jgi:hypothetical protein
MSDAINDWGEGPIGRNEHWPRPSDGLRRDLALDALRLRHAALLAALEGLVAEMRDAMRARQVVGTMGLDRVQTYVNKLTAILNDAPEG